MRKVLHKVKSHWIVLGVMGATVVTLGAADVQKVSAAEVEDAGVIETNQATTSSSVSNDPGTFSMEETLGEEAPNAIVELVDSNINESQEAVLEEGLAVPQNDTPAISYIGELEENVASTSIEETVNSINEIETQDVTAPVIDASTLKVSRTTATLGETITLSVNVSDDIGVTEVIAYYYSPTKINTPIYLHKNETNGLYEAMVTVDNSIQSGNWTLAQINASDSAGNVTRLGSTTANLAVANFTVTGTTADVSLPVIYPDSVKVSQTTATTGETVTVSAKLTDDVGVTKGVATYESPTGIYTSIELLENESSGLYEGTFVIDNSIQSGEWKLITVAAWDAAGNMVHLNRYYYDYSSADVTVSTNENDVTNPIIDVSSIKVSQPSAVPGDVITVSANLTDDFGVTLGRAFYKEPTGSLTSVNFLKNEITGIYEGTISINISTWSGNWSLASITAYDAAGNETTLSKGEVDLSAANFAVSGTLNVVSPPVIDETSINVSQKSAIPGNLLTVSARLTDDADVSEVCAYYYSPTEVITGKILSKNEISGLYEGTIYVDNYTQEGTWNIDSIVVFYNTGSAIDFSRDDVDFSAAIFTVTGTYASINPKLDASCWSSKHPKKFAITLPAKGGSGGGFLFSVALNYAKGDCRARLLDYSKSREENNDFAMNSPCLQPVWTYFTDLLKSAEMTNGNADTLNLINNKQAVLGTVWEDQVMAFLRDHQLPESFRMTLLKGGQVGSGDAFFVPADAKHPAAAMLLINEAFGMEFQAFKMNTKASRSPRSDFDYAKVSKQTRSHLLPDSVYPSLSLPANWQMTSALADALDEKVLSKH